MPDPRIAQGCAEVVGFGAAVAGALQGYLQGHLAALGCPDPERYRLSYELAPLIDPKGAPCES